MILIDHERYGEAGTYESIEEAEVFFGTMFPGTKFENRNGEIIDDTCEVVGRDLDYD